MTLTLSVLRCPDAVPPETRRITGGEFRIGRGQDNDWIMPDPDRMLSKRHCVVAFRNGGWAIADTSTNGTFLNREAEPLGAGQIRSLADGDRIRFGAYEIEVRIEQEQSFAAPPRSGGYGIPAASPFDDPFGDDVFAPRQTPPETFTSSAFGNDPLFGGPSQKQSVTMPLNYDPLAPNLDDDDFFSAPTVPDHSAAFSDAFKPPPVIPVAAPPPVHSMAAPPPVHSMAAPPPVHSMAAPPPGGAAKLIPDDDWDLDFPAAAPAPAPPPPLPPSPPPPPVAAASPFLEPADLAPAPPPPRPAPVAPPAPPPPAPAAAPTGDLMAAFLEGAGLSRQKPEDAEAAMRALGAAFRATISGIRQALIARSSIKGEFRIEQTMIRARGNNPLKFSADDDDALNALLGLGRRIDVTPDAAIADALRDMRLHELATMAAMQIAVRSLLAQLDPAKLRTEGETSGGINLLAAQKKARAFEAYEKLHANVTRALADDFDSVFGKAFARAYEVALRDISAKEPQ
jgi:type VI secretion system protein ImpI/type VI secretion system protein